LENLFRLYIPIVSQWQVLDATNPGIPELVALGEAGEVEKVIHETQWQLIKHGV
jgi:hypothetical protein